MKSIICLLVLMLLCKNTKGRELSNSVGHEHSTFDQSLIALAEAEDGSETKQMDAINDRNRLPKSDGKVDLLDKPNENNKADDSTSWNSYVKLTKDTSGPTSDFMRRAIKGNDPIIYTMFVTQKPSSTSGSSSSSSSSSAAAAIVVRKRQFNSWGGKRNFNSWGGKRNFNSWGRKRSRSRSDVIGSRIARPSRTNRSR